jgi:hypothetical protein
VSTLLENLDERRSDPALAPVTTIFRLLFSVPIVLPFSAPAGPALVELSVTC